MPGFSFPGAFFPGGEAGAPSAPPKPTPIPLISASSTSRGELFMFIPGPVKQLHPPTLAVVVVDTTRAEVHASAQSAEPHASASEAQVHPSASQAVLDDYG